jgi:hypothetical protein
MNWVVLLDCSVLERVSQQLDLAANQEFVMGIAGGDGRGINPHEEKRLVWGTGRFRGGEKSFSN